MHLYVYEYGSKALVTTVAPSACRLNRPRFRNTRNSAVTADRTAFGRDCRRSPGRPDGGRARRLVVEYGNRPIDHSCCDFVGFRIRTTVTIRQQGPSPRELVTPTSIFDDDRSKMHRTLKLLNAHVRNLFELTDHTDTWTLRFAEHKIAYIPIPKAANSSIRYSLLPLAGLASDEISDIQRVTEFDKVRFSKLAQEITSDWYVFTVVRNPYSRFVSAFTNKIGERESIFRAFARMGISSRDSIQRFSKVVENYPRRLLNDHIMPQSMLLSRATKFDELRIFKVESLSKDWTSISQSIADRVGRPIPPLRNENASRGGRNWRSYLTPEIIDFVNRVYADDFAAFGYEMEV